MVCEITYLITLNRLTFYFVGILKVEKVDKF